MHCNQKHSSQLKDVKRILTGISITILEHWAYGIVRKNHFAAKYSGNLFPAKLVVSSHDQKHGSNKHFILFI